MSNTSGNNNVTSDLLASLLNEDMKKLNKQGEFPNPFLKENLPLTKSRLIVYCSLLVAAIFMERYCFFIAVYKTYNHA
jgi:hypothetical protein